MKKEELSPLEAFRKYKNLDFCVATTVSELEEKASIKDQLETYIETTLKEYEELTKPKKITGTTTLNKALEQFLIDSCPDIDKKSKAVEIIKEKCLKIDFKVLLASTDYESYCFMLNSTKYLTQEEYNLLKEVLNNVRI